MPELLQLNWAALDSIGKTIETRNYYLTKEIYYFKSSLPFVAIISTIFPLNRLAANGSVPSTTTILSVTVSVPEMAKPRALIETFPCRLPSFQRGR